MSSKEIVSIWTASTGWASSTLQDVVSPEYSEDGDFLGSEFSNAFSLGFIDDDTIEADKIDPTHSLIKAIEGCSYDSDIVSDMKNKNTPPTESPIDTIVAIYDYSFSGTPKNTTIRNVLFTYRGSFEYRA
ncbi:hypothetical protein F0169_07400 [Pseudomonas sp. MAFF 212408]|uniref:Immunity protein 22 of polymorphic toxin system n=1 Tax=Pseudomonas kitaguniensis TaxID=2607908 RepID=A0A5N7KI77_9PSED|nr:immunity 22 family protein [Pseudomonas kitaguniensis]MPR01917.1 hypothetical protein [Pseudomonas kitaguniensis]